MGLQLPHNISVLLFFNTLNLFTTAKNNLLFIFQQCQKEHSDGRVQLRDILSVPMQRILKYHLLLDKLVQETSPVSFLFYFFFNCTLLINLCTSLIIKTHEDYRGLERAKEAMVDVAQFTNEVKRDSEHLAVIQKVRVSMRFIVQHLCISDLDDKKWTGVQKKNFQENR